MRSPSKGSRRPTSCTDKNKAEIARKMSVYRIEPLLLLVSVCRLSQVTNAGLMDFISTGFSCHIFSKVVGVAEVRRVSSTIEGIGLRRSYLSNDAAVRCVPPPARRTVRRGGGGICCATPGLEGVPHPKMKRGEKAYTD